jgi:hypothetical protein
MKHPVLRGSCLPVKDEEAAFIAPGQRCLGDKLRGKVVIKVL